MDDETTINKDAVIDSLLSDNERLREDLTRIKRTALAWNNLYHRFVELLTDPKFISGYMTGLCAFAICLIVMGRF